MEPILLTLLALFDQAESLAANIIVQAHCLAKDPVDRLSSFPEVNLLGSWFLDERTTQYISLRDRISTVSETLKAFRRPEDDVDRVPTPQSTRGYYFDSTTVPRTDQQSLATIVRNVIAELETYNLRRIIYDPVDTKSFEYLTKLNSSLVCRLRQSGTDWAVGYGKYRPTNHIHDKLKGTCSPETVFLFAAEAGLDDIVHSLLFDPTSTTLTQNARTLTRACDRQGSTALHLAVSGNRVKMVKSLLNAEADVLAADNAGSTPLQLLLSSSRTFLFGRRQFPSAVGTSRRRTARQVIVEEDFRHLDLEFWNLVMKSVFTNHGSTIEGSNKLELSESVKDILGPALERLIGGATPQKALFEAVRNNHEYFVRALLECYDIVNAPQDGKGSKETAIVVAVQTSNTRMMEVLETYGADINIEN